MKVTKVPIKPIPSTITVEMDSVEAYELYTLLDQIVWAQDNIPPSIANLRDLLCREVGK
jgi:hypothetical protein